MTSSTVKAVIVVRDICIGNKKSDVLLPLCGLTLLERTLYTLKGVGIEDFLIICGARCDSIKKHIKARKLDRNFNLTLFEKTQDIGLEDNQFLVLDGNVIFGENIIRDLLAKESKDSIICVDSSPKYFKTDKELHEEFVNTGIFLCNRKNLTALRGSIQEPLISEESTKRTGIEIHDVNGAFWDRISRQEDFERAEGVLLSRNLTYLEGKEDFVARYTRRFPAKFLARNLVKTPVTPNQLTLLVFLLYLAAGSFFCFGEYAYDIIAGVLVLLAFTLDHTDGVVARLKHQTSKFGTWLDGMFDWIGFSAVIFGASIGLYIKTDSILPLIVGVLLLLLHLTIDYDAKLSREVVKSESAPSQSLVATLPTFRRKTFQKLYNFYIQARFLYFGGGVMLSLIFLGAVLNVMLIIFLILFAAEGIPWLAGFVIRCKDRKSIG